MKELIKISNAQFTKAHKLKQWNGIHVPLRKYSLSQLNFQWTVAIQTD